MGKSLLANGYLCGYVLRQHLPITHPAATAAPSPLMGRRVGVLRKNYFPRDEFRRFANVVGWRTSYAFFLLMRRFMPIFPQNLRRYVNENAAERLIYTSETIGRISFHYVVQCRQAALTRHSFGHRTSGTW